MFAFGKYKEKTDDQKYNETYVNYFMDILDNISTIFYIESDKIKQSSEDILKYAILNGHCGCVKIGDNIVFGTGSYTGELDFDGRGKEYIITFKNGEEKRGVIGENVVVLPFNNSRFSQRSKIEKYATLLTDTDVSLDMNLVYSRVCPIPIVKTDIEERSMNNIVDSVIKGKMKVFKRASHQDILNPDRKEENVLNLTNPSTSTYIQNLSRLHDDVVRRLYLDFGVEITNKDKGAQINTEELTQEEDLCAMITNKTLLKLKQLKKDMKEVFNIDINVGVRKYGTSENDIVSRETLKSVESEDVVNENN